LIPVDEQITYLKKGFVEVIREEELRERILTGRPLKVKVGFDPTAPDLHLGHTVLLRKMKHFEDMGHKVIFVMGDGTARIGDPTGRNMTRPPLTHEEILENAATYKAQVFKILHPEKTEIRFNSEWLDGLGFENMIRLCAKYTVARLLERDDFDKRYKEGIPISIHELLYPLAQAYDSVALNCDVELGGSDQKFNLLVGREIQRDYGQLPQIIGTTPLLEGTDGVNKMSKSYGNYVGIDEAPDVIFGKLMAISDDLMLRYYELLSDISLTELHELKEGIRQGTIHPMESKLRFAQEMVRRFHGPDKAIKAEEHWKKIHREGEIPADVERIRRKRVSEPVWLPGLLKDIGMVPSTSEGRRIIEQGGVYVKSNDILTKVVGESLSVDSDELTFKVGKKKFKTVVFEDQY